jgi:hypothetical protein
MMDADFRDELNKVLHGGYNVGDLFSSYATLAVDAGTGARRRQATELHECVHSELSDMSAYGWFQQFLYLASRHPDRELRGKARRIFDDSMAATVVTQEGLASLRELAWISANETDAEATAFLRGIPDLYHTGLSMAQSFFLGVGDPRKPYLGFTPPAFHVAVVALGLAVMNSPILAAYADPEVLLAGRDLRWITRDGPDQRFAALLSHRDSIANMLTEVLRRAKRKGARITRTDVLLDVYDFACKAVQRGVPGFPLVARDEARHRIRSFTDSWSTYLNERYRGPQFISPALSGITDITDERALNMRYGRLNHGDHEVYTVGTADIDSAAFVEAHEHERIAGIFRFVIFTTLPPSLPAELMRDCDMGLLSAPLWAGSVSQSSPLVRFQPVLSCTARMPDLVERSGELSSMGCIWYSNLTMVRSIRSLKIPLQGFAIEKCDSPAQVLDLAEGSTYGTFSFGDETVLAVMSDDTFTFSLGSWVQTDAFTKRTVDRGLTKHDGRPFRVGGRDASAEFVARAALWGFVG